MRLKDGSLSAGKKILIDGQQRVTALTAALVGQQVINKNYKQVQIRIAFNPQSEIFEVRNPAIEKDKAWIPDIAPVIQEDIGLLSLIRQYTEANDDVDEDHLERVITRLKSITRKQIGVIELSADLDIETVTEIFIRINREGVTLSQADFAMSKIAANESHGGNLMRKAIDYFCHLAVAPEFYAHIEKNDPDFVASDYFRAMRWLRYEQDDLYDPSYSDMLRVALLSSFSRGKISDLVALLSGRNFETKRFEDEIAAESFASLKNGIMAFMRESHFKKFLMIIQSAGFIDSSLLRSQSPLNFAYALYLKLRQMGLDQQSIERSVRRWFVFSLLTGRYSGSIESNFDNDIRQVDDRGPEDCLTHMEAAELSDAFWEVGLLQDLTTSNSRHPAFLTLLAAQARDGVRGFLSKDITVRSMIEHRGDMHHIFPKAFLKNELKLTRSQYNQVANFAVTQQEINIAIGKKPPCDYLGTVRKQCEGQKPVYGAITEMDDLRRNFGENAVPLALLDGNLDDYHDFLAARRALMAEKIRDYYRSL